MSTITYGVKGRLPHWLPDTAVSVCVCEREREKERECSYASKNALQKKKKKNLQSWSTVPNTLRVLFFCSFHMKLDNIKAPSSQSIVISLRAHHKWAFFWPWHLIMWTPQVKINVRLSGLSGRWRDLQKKCTCFCAISSSNIPLFTVARVLLTSELQEGFSSDDSSMTDSFAYLCRCNWTVGHCTITPVCQIIRNVFCSQTGALACLSDNATSSSRWCFA